jgi:hypothetical protein
VCGAIGAEGHIFSGRCRRVRGLGQKRHNEVAQIIIATVKQGSVSNWSYIGKLDKEVPSMFVGHNWKHKIPPVMCEDMDGLWRPVRHIKPDSVLANNFAPERIVICLVEFSIVADGDIEMVKMIKHERYQPLCKIIREFLGPGEHSVYVVPVVWGRSGIPPQGWAQTCADIKVAIKPSVLSQRVTTAVLEHGKSMFTNWQRHNGLN